MDRLISEKALLDKIDEWKGFDTVTIRLSTLRNIVKAIPSAEPSGDLISRQAAIKSIEERAKRIKNEDTLNGLAGAVGILFELPSVKPQPCEDAISRKALKHKLQEHHDFFVNAYGGFSNLPQNDKSRVDEILNCIAMVVNEPPVKPQEPKYCDRNICLRNEYNGIGCDECEVGNPCLYCKNEFEPQESEDKE